MTLLYFSIIYFPVPSEKPGLYLWDHDEALSFYGPWIPNIHKGQHSALRDAQVKTENIIKISKLTTNLIVTTLTGNSYEEFIRPASDWWPRARVWCLILFKALSSMATRSQRLCSTIAPVVSRSNVASSWIFKQWNKIWGTPDESFSMGGPKCKGTWKSGVDGGSQGLHYWDFDRPITTPRFG